MAGSCWAILTASALTAASSAQGAALADFTGHWSCKGNFSNGAAISAELSVDSDLATGALIVRHDDVAPGVYHSFEVWMPNKSGTGLRAALSDKYSGMRWFESAGWAGQSLTWTRLENGVPAEQFVYEFKASVVQIQWSIVKGGAMTVGDTVTCERR